MALSAVGLAVALRILRFMLGLVLLWLAADGYLTGVGQLVYRLVSRKENPVLYWVAIVLAGMSGSILLLGAVFPQLDRM